MRDGPSLRSPLMLPYIRGVTFILLRALGWFLAAPASRHELVLEKTALERAVIERYAAGGGKAYQLREPQIGRENPGGPPGEAPLQDIPQLRIQRRELRVLAQSLTVGRVHHDHAGFSRRTRVEHGHLLQLYRAF